MDEKVTLEAGLPPPSVTVPTAQRQNRLKRLIPLVGLLALGWYALSLNTLGSSLVPSSDSRFSASIYGLSRPVEVPGFKHKKEKHGGKKHHGKHGKPHKHGEHKPKHGGCENHHDRFPPKKVEEVYLSVPDHTSVRDALRRYTKANHIAGNGQDKLDAINLKNEWERLLGVPVSGPEEKVYEAGSVESQESIRGGMSKLDVWVDTYYPLMTYPVTSSVTLLSDPPFKAKLQEDIVAGDPDSILRDEVRPFHGYSVSGDAQAPIVYVGYGRKADFDFLAEKGVDITGKIALVKYGIVYRGLKVKAAQEAGAVGCIIFTDPGDDGEVTVEHGYEEYPEGPARQPSSVQRGSVQFLSVYPGDPSTPGEPAYANATRVESGNQPSIPSLPISYEDAIPILNSLKGQGILAKDLKSDWVGGLGYRGVEYWTGPSEADVHLVNEVNTRINPIWNTMAVIPGMIPDEVVIYGNHRDAWILGASDPNSGTATQHELIKGLGQLLSQGWKPTRTIVLASWDAEEYGLVGSTEWTEDFGDWLKENAAVYLNLDSSASGGILGMAASPSLAWTLRKAASDVLDTNSSVSVLDSRSSLESWAEWRAEQYGLSEDEDVESMFASETKVAPMGSGSDFTSFLQRYGIACGEAGFGGGPKSAVYHYHSIYDSFNWMDKYGDPGFISHINAAKINGLTLLRLADSFILPLNTTQYAVDMVHYLEKIRYIAKGMDAAESLNLDKLSQAIDAVSSASAYLDAQKTETLDEIHKLVPGFETHGARVCGPSGGHNGKKSWKAWLKSHFGSCKQRHGRHGDHHDRHGHGDGDVAPRLPRNLPVIDNKTIKKLEKTMSAVREINKKLQYFEGGFISEEGIKGREWYKHKGVAPGLWLGYGATTFPALTEALTIDHDVELAQKEADELAAMLNAMAKKLRA